ncbi:110 kDa U5 small nuclear ribonucleoprotein component CLO-like [Pyrus x bretschneideri]|uniref:110 kDa U5 small nuclear ribonucleoprotein component CLO-like n=1 Tax=Pyrus x bretschneideri TaxID=225117 RepID=UPI0020306AEC|nr:110 kDa U5 small nuclear ribonucleoprotein component CLO-like [Pyrus x bretschneideri]
MSNPSLVRNVALVGHLQHEKTVFMDMLVKQTHHMSTFDSNNDKHMRYMNTRTDEQERRISIKIVPISLVLEDSKCKSYLCNIMDMPGHVNFFDEMTTALKLADGVVLIVDTAKHETNLKNMVYLRGTLHISKLENAVNAGEVNLKRKEMIQKVLYSTQVLSGLEYFLSKNSLPDIGNSVAYYICHCIHFLLDFA